MREAVLKRVREDRLIAIVRGVYGEACLNLAQALLAGGITMLEVTFDQSAPDRWSETVGTISRLERDLGGRMVFGAGTVLSPAQVMLAESAGAQFVVSPDVNPAVIETAVSRGLAAMPGAMTPTEILTAARCGADLVKLFPAGDLGPHYFKAVSAPINHIPLLAVGGIDEKNLADFLTAGAIGVGVGGNLVNKKWIAAGAFDRITELARTFTRQLH